MKLTVYGIKNCSTMKKTFDWLTEHQLTYDFVDYKKQLLPATLLTELCEDLGWENVINTKGLTWRKLDETQKDIHTTEQALALMQTNPSMIRRPIMSVEDIEEPTVLIGFDPEQYYETLIK